MTSETFNIYTVGGIEYIYQILRGIVMIFGASAYQTFVKAFMIWGLLIASFWLIFPDRLRVFFSYFLFTFFVFNGFFALKKDVTIIDTQFSEVKVVSNVPLGPALVAYFASTTSHYITGKIDGLFHEGTVNVWTAEGGTEQVFASSSMDYRSTGYGGMFDYIALLKKMDFYKVATPEIREFTSMLNTFLYQCTWNEIAVMKEVDIENTFNNASDLMTAIKPGANQFMTYEGSLTTCVDFYNGTEGQTGLVNKYEEVKKQVDPGNSESGSIYAMLGMKTKDKDVAADVINNILGGSVDLTNMIMQAGLTHAYYRAGARYAAGFETSSALRLTVLYI
jgi:hypothetical protein